MDLIRTVLGEPRISYLGGSYAALLGVVYSTLFPGRIDRLVLDSPPNLAPSGAGSSCGAPARWRRTSPYSWTGWRPTTRRTISAPPRRRRGPRSLPRATVAAAFARANAEPIVAGDHAWTVGELGNLFLLATLFEQLWPVVALDAAAVFGGSPPPIPLPIRPSALPGTPGVPADNHTAVNLAGPLRRSRLAA